MIFGISVWLWLLLLLDVMILIWSVEHNESCLICAVANGVTGALGHLAFGISVLSLIVANPLLTTLIFIGYIVAGVVWALPKWWFYVRGTRNEYLKYLRKYLEDNRVKNWDTAVEVPDYLLNKYLKIHETSMWRRRIPVKAASHKHRIMTWVVWWPFSMAWTLIDEPFKRLYRQVWNLSKRSFEAISESALGGVAIQSRPIPIPTSETEDFDHQILEGVEDKFELYVDKNSIDTDVITPDK